MRRRAIAGLIAGTIMLAPAAAWAHVTVDPGEAPKGAADQELTFRVPNESDTASTTKIEMKLPTDHPMLGVSVASTPGWTAKVETTKLDTPVKTDDGEIDEVVSMITWSGGSIAPSEYGDFRIIAGELPDDADQLVFKVIQTYSDGSEVSWIEDPAPEGQEEPEHPAAVLALVSDSGSDSSSSSGSHHSGTDGAAPTVTAGASQDDVDQAKNLGLAGVAIGAIALIVAIGALVAARRGDDA